MLTSVEKQCINGTAAAKALSANRMPSTVVEAWLRRSHEFPVHETVASSETLPPR